MSITDYAAQTQWSERWVRNLAARLGITRLRSLLPDDVERLDADIARRNDEALTRNLLNTAESLEKEYRDEF